MEVEHSDHNDGGVGEQLARAAEFAANLIIQSVLVYNKQVVESC